MNMKPLLLSSVTLTALLVASCSSDDPIAVNPDPVGNAITFSPLVDRNTRATETTITNLGDFGVFARSVDFEGALYDYYVIGSQTAPEMAKKSGSIDTDVSKWILDRKVYWPEGVNRVLFWALTTQNGKTGETGVLSNNGTLTFESTGPQIKDFTPIRADHKLAEYSDGKLQQDLVGAFTAQEASVSQSNILLNFNHELTQIQIWAKSNDASTDNRRVYIKGAWVVNVESKGTFNANYTWNNGPMEDPLWIPSTNIKVAYGSLYKDKDPILLTAKAQDLLSIDAVPGSLMLVPQGITAWNQNGAAGNTDWASRPGYEDAAAATTDAYILLYCRIELEHDGDEHKGDDGSEKTDDKIFIENGNHYHQLFPVMDKFDRTKYGYTCVPIGGTKAEPFKWERGKRYIYTLSICGPNSGGGVYPPILPPDIPKDPDVPVVPDDKKPGDPVLSSEISFTVTVSDWENNTEWLPGENGGNIDLQ